jgi:hypothetical protein
LRNADFRNAGLRGHVCWTKFKLRRLQGHHLGFSPEGNPADLYIRSSVSVISHEMAPACHFENYVAKPFENYLAYAGSNP